MWNAPACAARAVCFALLMALICACTGRSAGRAICRGESLIIGGRMELPSPSGNADFAKNPRAFLNDLGPLKEGLAFVYCKAPCLELWFGPVFGPQAKLDFTFFAYEMTESTIQMGMEKSEGRLAHETDFGGLEIKEDHRTPKTKLTFVKAYWLVRQIKDNRRISAKEFIDALAATGLITKELAVSLAEKMEALGISETEDAFTLAEKFDAIGLSLKVKTSTLKEILDELGITMQQFFLSINAHRQGTQLKEKEKHVKVEAKEKQAQIEQQSLEVEAHEVRQKESRIQEAQKAIRMRGQIKEVKVDANASAFQMDKRKSTMGMMVRPQAMGRTLQTRHVSYQRKETIGRPAPVILVLSPEKLNPFHPIRLKFRMLNTGELEARDPVGYIVLPPYLGDIDILLNPTEKTKHTPWLTTDSEGKPVVVWEVHGLLSPGDSLYFDLTARVRLK